MYMNISGMMLIRDYRSTWREIFVTVTFCYYKSHVNWPRIKPGPPVTNCLSYLIVLAHSAKKCSCSCFSFTKVYMKSIGCLYVLQSHKLKTFMEK